MENGHKALQAMLKRGIVPFFILLYFILSIYLMLPYAVGVVGSGYTGLDSSPYGVPSRPVVYRVLVPNIARAVHAVIPDAVEKPLTERMTAWRDSEEGKAAVKAWFIRHPPLGDDKIFETAVVAFVTYLTMLAFIWMLFTLTKELFPESLAYALVVPLLALQLIPALTVENGYIYDFAELFFSCALFYLMLKQRWRLYLVALVLGTLNKETTLFGIFFFAVWFFPRMPRAQFMRLMIQQLLIYIAIKGGVTLYYAALPGVVAGHFFPQQMQFMQDHALAMLGGFSAIAFFMGYRWREKPVFLRAGLWMLLPNYAAYLTCVPGEWRDLYWCLPVMLILATHTLIAIAGIADLEIFRPDIKKAA